MSGSQYMKKSRFCAENRMIDIFKENELPEKLKKISAIKPGSRNLSNG